MTATAGTNQTATVGTAVATAPAVKILDENGKPISGLPVTFSVTSGGGSLSGTSGTTDDLGVARSGSWTLGTTAGPNTVVASAEGLSPVTFTATATAGNPTSITSNSSETQTGVVGAEVGAAPSVLLEDAYGNPVPQAAVTFSVTSGGGAVSGGSATTNASGIATVGGWTLGTLPGLNTLQAAYSGLSPVSFSATAEPDAPDAVTVTSGDNQTATVGTQVEVLPTVEVTDQYGNQLEGVSVTFAVESGGGAITGESQTTNASGRATVESWTLGTTSGTHTLSATVEGLEPAMITATAEAGAPVQSLAASGTNQTATVGNATDLAPTVRVEDAYGNGVPDIAVTFVETATPSPVESTGEAPGESRVVTGGTQTTDANGEASPDSWTLGTTAGTYELTAFVAGLGAPVTFNAMAMADDPSIVAAHSGDNQSAQFGQQVASPPTVIVTDQYGNPVEGVQVTFAVASGGGTATGLTATTGADGTASVGSWTMGPTPGPNTLTATADGIGTVTFNATGTALIPANITKIAGDGQSATVATAVAIAPQVRVTDASSIPVPGVSVTFAVTAGGGTVTGATTTTDSNGLASAGSWTLGNIAGTNTLTATVSGVTPTTFSATGTAGTAVVMTKNAGDAQSAVVGTAVTTPPSVLVQDIFGNAVPGVGVTFAVSAGGGSVTGGTATSNASGIATVGSWTLGPSEGSNSLTASSTGLGSLVFTALGTAVPAGGGFAIDLVFLSSSLRVPEGMPSAPQTISASQQTIFENAATRWQQIIVGDVPDFSGTLPAASCLTNPITTGVDDVVIEVSVTTIDGVGGVLGQAGPCYLRSGTPFPLTGRMMFDVADINSLEASGQLQDVITHEMGHVLGIGTLWNYSPWAFQQGTCTADPYFNGSQAISAFNTAGGSGRTSPKVPVENTGGSGTICSHWRETVHNSELMTGWIEASGSNPLSTITIASLADMGYTVNMSAADPYSVFDPSAALRAEPVAKIFLNEMLPPTPITVDRTGRVIRRE